MKIREKGLLSIVILLLGLVMVMASGCATSGNQVQLGNQDSGFSSIKKSARGNDAVNQRSKEITKEENAPPMSSDELESSGDAYFANDNILMAFVSYEKALQSNGKNPRLVYKKGMLLLSAGLYEDAEKVFDQLINDEPNNAPAHLALGRVYFQMKRYDDAKQSLERAVKLDPSFWAAYNLLGVIYDNWKEYEIALVQYRKALSLRPQEGMLYHNLGVCMSLQEKYAEATEAFKVAIVKGYRKSSTYNSLGLSLSKLGRYQEAFESFKTGGTVASAYNNLGFVYLNEGKRGDAIECFERAIASNPKFYERASENLKSARVGSSEIH
jgi:tetratricopeptide (TPR) repeat protein